MSTPTDAACGPETITFMDPAIQECPYPAYKVIRDTASIWRDPVTGYLVVGRYDDLRDVLTDTEHFSNDRFSKVAMDQLDDRARRMLQLYEQKGWRPAATLGGRDDPNHKQMRAMYDVAFRAGKIKGLDPLVEQTAYKLIDAFIQDGHCDWVKQFSVPLPLIIIGKQMGAKEEDIWRIKAWTDAWVQRLGMMQTEDEERWSVEMEIEAQHYFQPIFERLRRQPDDTLLSDLVNTVIPEWGRTLNDNELHAEMMADTFVGGSETSTNALSAGMMLAIQNPDVWARLKQGNDKDIRTFVEEVLRLESPAQGLFRITTKDKKIGDTLVPAGSILNVRYASANRDEQHFECPERLNLDRKNAGSHMAFGSGIHHCLGAPLARRELYWGFKAMIDRFDHIQFAEGKNDFSHAPNFMLRALRELHIEFRPRT
jgi:cytochrome P450